jgi:hypothetical protein
MSDLALQRVGPTFGASGTATPLRADVTGAQVTTDAHGTYWEAARNGNLWILPTAYAGVTLVAASAIGQTAWSPVLGLYNPTNSGKLILVVSGMVNYISGTPPAGGVVWGFVPGPSGITAAGGNAAINALTQQIGGSIAKTFVMAAMTGSIASQMLCSYPISPFAGAVAATTPLGAWHLVNGMFLVPPGGAIGLGGAAGTTCVVQATIAWEELPYLT